MEMDCIEQEQHCVCRELLQEGGYLPVSCFLYPRVYGYEVVLAHPRKGHGLCSVELL